MNHPERPTIHYSELPPAEPDSELATEWEFYRREVGRLLAEGHEDKFVVIKGEQIIGFYDSWDAARMAGLQRYLMEAFLTQRVRTREPLLVRGLPVPCRD